MRIGWPRVHQQRALDPLLVEVGAVRGAEVLDIPLATAVGEAGVSGAGEVVGEDQRRVVRAADQDRLVTEVDLGTAEWAGRHHEGAQALLAALLPGGGAGRDRRDPTGSAAEEGGAPHPGGSEDEKPQKPQ